jgi:hypothetical protein
LASLPAELAPATYTESETGANVHKSKIKTAYEDAEGQPSSGDWCRLYKLVEMTCTRTKFRSLKAQMVRNDIDEGDEVPWILAETEEDWEDWRRSRNQGKSKEKNTYSTQVVNQETVSQLEDKDINTSPSRSKAINEKVSSWKATLDVSVKSGGVSGVTKRQKTITDLSRSSPLGFPVVKTCAGATTKKSKVLLTKSAPEAPQIKQSYALLGNVSPKDKSILSVSSEPVSSVCQTSGAVLISV